MTPPKEKNQAGSTKRKFHGKPKGKFKHRKTNPKLVTVYSTITNTPTPVKPYSGTIPHSTMFNFHHAGNCLIYNICKLRDHTAKFCIKAPNHTTSTIAAGGS